MAQLFARLNSRRDLQLDLVAVDAGQADRAAKRRGREAHRAVGNQCRSLARIDRMPLHVDEQVKIAASCSAYARLALTGDADACAFIDACGNLHRQLALGQDSTLAVAGGARICDDLTGAAAGRAAALDDEEALLGTNLPHATASLAGARTA